MKILCYVSSRVTGPLNYYVTIDSVKDVIQVIDGIIGQNSGYLERPDGDTLELLKNAWIPERVYNSKQKIVDWVNGGTNPFLKASND